MRALMPSLAAAALLAGCAVAPAPVPVAARAQPPAVVVAPGHAPRTDPYCREERREAQSAQRFATRETREAYAYGGRRQAYEAAAAQSAADRQRRQAQRAC